MSSIARTLLLVGVVCALPLASVIAAPITIDTVLIGNPGNAHDTLSMVNTSVTGFGSVAYKFRMGTFEVTNSQYAAFLSAVAASDPRALYHTSMNSSSHGGITRSGTSGSYTYAVKPGMADKPVNYVSWYDAIRFVNWLHNNQPSGSDAWMTESGAYTLSGSSEVPNNKDTLTRNPGAKWWLPNEHEWYKAAYHKNDGATGNYFLYPTGSDTAPSSEGPPGGANSANFDGGVGTVTEVGAYFDSLSAYGTFDQGGNVAEWNETAVGFFPGFPFGSPPEVASRGVRGGGWNDDLSRVAASYRDSGGAISPTHSSLRLGFRVATVATVPEPSSLLMAILAAVPAIIWRCFRR